MTTTTGTLMSLVAQLLSAATGDPPVYPTSAGARVYAPRDWPTFDNMYPAVFVSAPRERKRSLGSAGAPEFVVTSTIRVTARSSSASGADGDSGQLQAQLWILQRQIEATLVNNPPLMSLLEKFGDISTEFAFKASGEKHLGELEMLFDLQFYQGPEDFYDVAGTPLAGVDLSTQFETLAGHPAGLQVTFPPQT